MSQNIKTQVKYLGAETVTGLSAAKAIAPPMNAELALIRVEGAPVRYMDAGTPTAGSGMPLGVGDTLEYDGIDPATGQMYPVKFIEQSASATLSIMYYQYAPG